MIVTVLGGTAHSTPVFAAALARSELNSLNLRLAGRNAERLSSVARACRLLCPTEAVNIEWYGRGEWQTAVRGADVVVVQLRIGGYVGRAFDETFPLDFGVPGDEGLGPGGLSAAYRAWPQLSKCLNMVRENVPGSRTILLTSPGSLLVRLAAVSLPGWNVIHACELPWTTFRHICHRVEVDSRQVTFDYIGVNHLGWLYNMRVGGSDILQRYPDGNGEDSFPTAKAVRSIGAYPLKYLRLHYQKEEVVREQLTREITRSEELARIAASAFEVYRAGDVSDIRRVLGRRRAEWYTDAVVPLLCFWAGYSPTPDVFLTCSPSTACPREKRYRGVRGVLSEIPPLASPPEEVSILISRFQEFERIAAAAVIDGGTSALSEALAAHPWVHVGAAAMAKRIADYSEPWRATEEMIRCLN